MHWKEVLIVPAAAAAMTLCVAGNRAQDVDHFQRAGHSQEISRLAQPSNGPGSIGYYVGGGALALFRGEAPYSDEGTWGWDYRGWLLPRRVSLLWWHGRRTQGGVGAYKSDGPKLPPLHDAGGHEGGER